MIAGIGIDTVSIARMTTSIQRDAFIIKVFSKAEIEYCNANSKKGQHYAVRFAAKEAFLKASGKGLTAGYDLKDIEIVHEASGKPVINLYGVFAKLRIENQWTSIHLSLSHDADRAVAIVIIEK
jgi:holo-[acyl-carrier protein] synthase